MIEKLLKLKVYWLIKVGAATADELSRALTAAPMREAVRARPSPATLLDAAVQRHEATQAIARSDLR